MCRPERGPIRIWSKITELSFAGPVFIIFLLITEGFREQRLDADCFSFRLSLGDLARLSIKVWAER